MRLSGATLAQTIANAHMFYNGLGVLAMLPLGGLCQNLLNRLGPAKREKRESQTLAGAA